MLLCASSFFVACESDEEEQLTDIPTDKNAGTPPTVTENTVAIPNMSAPYVEEGSNGLVGNISFTGIKGVNGNYIDLKGTDAGSQQNIWLTIDGVQKSIKIVNAGKSNAKGLADIIFLIDNSGSMSEEADSIAKQVLDWSKILTETVDCQFGCVGYGDNYYGVDGGMDMADVSVLDEFLSRRGYSGTDRTYGFYGDSADKLKEKALSYDNGYYNGSYNECGALALHFADELFSFRDDANRIYINFTDEPNQPNGYKQWSVETLNSNSDLYNWNASKGTIHTVYSESDTLEYKEPNGWYYRYNLQYPYSEYEKPWAMSEYTGGATIFADSRFKKVTLNGLEVTAAITNTYIMRFNITEDLRKGTHTLVITVKDPSGNGQAVKMASIQFSLE